MRTQVFCLVRLGRARISPPYFISGLVLISSDTSEKPFVINDLGLFCCSAKFALVRLNPVTFAVSLQ
jgi:hypothetical protein